MLSIPRAALLAVSVLGVATTASAQMDAVAFVGLPPVGSWAEYEVVTVHGNDVMSSVLQSIALVSVQQADDDEYFWFEVKGESDDFGPDRRTTVTQFAIRRSDADKGVDLMRHVREMIVQIEGMETAFRIASDYVQRLAEKGLFTGGSRGAGTSVDYTFTDLESRELETRAGTLPVQGKKGVGQAEVVLSLENPKRTPVDSIRELWFNPDVPFGMVQQITRTVNSSSPDNVVTSEETVELLAFGTGATSSIRGEVRDYSEFLQAAQALQAAQPGQPAQP